MNKKNNKIPVIINCDSGIEDIVSLLLAVKSNKLDIKLILSNYERVSAKTSANNILKVLDLIDAPEIPVISGEDEFLENNLSVKQISQKKAFNVLENVETKRQLITEDATKFMYNTIVNSEQKITIICIAPMTNIAKLIQEHNDVSEKIEKILIVDNSVSREKEGFSDLDYDTKACEILFKSNIDTYIISSTLNKNASLDWQDVFKTKNLNFTGEQLELMYRECEDNFVKHGIALIDAYAIAYTIAPEIFKTENVSAKLSYLENNKIKLLLTNQSAEKSNIKLIECTSILKFKKLYFKCLKGCK